VNVLSEVCFFMNFIILVQRGCTCFFVGIIYFGTFYLKIFVFKILGKNYHTLYIKH